MPPIDCNNRVVLLATAAALLLAGGLWAVSRSGSAADPRQSINGNAAVHFYAGIFPPEPTDTTLKTWATFAAGARAALQAHRPVPASPCLQSAYEAEDLEFPVCSYADGGLDAVFQAHSAPCKHPLSCRESLYFIDENDSAWQRRKDRHARQQLVQSLKQRSCDAATWFQSNWEPTLSCSFEERVGTMGDGGKWVCDPHRIVGSPGQCLIYSAGSNNVFDFEEAVRAYRGDCEVHTFDPTASPPPANSPAAAFVQFHAYGLGATAASVPLGGLCGSDCPVKSLHAIVAELGHTQRVIDIFKIDIEGGEFETLTEMLWQCTFPRNIRMILIEIHSRNTADMPLKLQKLFLGLAHAGYAIYHKEPNTLGCHGGCIEYAFLQTRGL